MKKWMSLALVLALALSLCACGGSGSSGSTGSTETQAAVEEPPVQETTANTDLSKFVYEAASYGYSLSEVGTIADPERTLEHNAEGLIRKNDDGSFCLLTVLGEDKLNMSLSKVDYVGKGLYVVTSSESSPSNPNTMGLVDENGTVLIPCSAAWIGWKSEMGPGNERYLEVIYAQEETKDDAIRFVSVNDTEHSPIKLNDSVMYAGYSKVYDLKFNRFVPDVTNTNPERTAFQPCGDSFVVTDTDGMSRLYNSDGKVLFVTTNPFYTQNDIAMEMDSGTYRVYDQEGNTTAVVNNPIYFIEGDNGFMTMSYNGKNAIIDRYGKQVTNNLFDGVTNESNGIFLVRNGSYYGLMTADGTFLQTCDKFEFIQPMGNTLFHSFEEKDDEYIYSVYSSKGVVVSDWVGAPTDMVLVQEGKALVINEAAFTYPVTKEYPQVLRQGLIIQENDFSGTMGVVDLFTGTELLPSEYETVFYCAGHIFAYSADTWTVYKLDGPVA